jgi:beta-phosphoglucomutase
MAYDGLLFDFDGVLADSEGLHYRCWTEILAPLAIPLSWETYCANCIGITDRAMLEVLAAQTDPPRDVEDLWQYYPAKKALFRERALAAPPIAAETRSLLADLMPLPLAVVTSSGAAEVVPVLEKAGILAFFQQIVTGDDVANRKPHPEPYLLAASRMGVKNPLVIEDSEAGEASGRAAGFEVLRLRSPEDLNLSVRSALGTFFAAKKNVN